MQTQDLMLIIKDTTLTPFNIRIINIIIIIECLKSTSQYFFFNFQHNQLLKHFFSHRARHLSLPLLQVFLVFGLQVHPNCFVSVPFFLANGFPSNHGILRVFKLSLLQFLLKNKSVYAKVQDLSEKLNIFRSLAEGLKMVQIRHTGCQSRAAEWKFDNLLHLAADCVMCGCHLL